MKRPPHDPIEHDFARENSADAAELPVPRVRRQRVSILHADRHAVVINQPAFAEPVITPDANWRLLHDGQDVDELLELEPLYTVFPVEEGASGVVVLARSPKDRMALLGQLHEGEMEVFCLALVRGPIRGDGGTLDTPLISGFASPSAQPGTEPLMPCQTDWRVRDAYVGFALLECRPRTSARDQIRLHLRAADMPLAVDPLNDGPQALMLSSFKTDYHRSRRHGERPLIERTSMHFETARFRDVASGRTIHCTAPMARDLRAAVNQLGRFGRMPKG